jgi:hypothetical protein
VIIIGQKEGSWDPVLSYQVGGELQHNIDIGGSSIFSQNDRPLTNQDHPTFRLRSDPNYNANHRPWPETYLLEHYFTLGRQGLFILLGQR